LQYPRSSTRLDEASRQRGLQIWVAAHHHHSSSKASFLDFSKEKEKEISAIRVMMMWSSATVFVVSVSYKILPV